MQQTLVSVERHPSLRTLIDHTEKQTKRATLPGLDRRLLVWTSISNGLFDQAHEKSAAGASACS